MENVKMNYADLKLLEKDLHRELTDDEAVFAYQHGFKALLNKLNLSGERYIGYRRLLDLIITKFTKSEVEFDRFKRSKDFRTSLALIGELLMSIKDENEFSFDDEDTVDESFCDQEDECKAQNGGLEVHEVGDIILGMIPDGEKHWLELYKTIDPEMGLYRTFIENLYYDDDAHGEEESVGDALDLIKDEVVESIAESLADGEEFDLPDDVLDEVTDYIAENWVNYSIKIVNNHISCKKF